MDISETERSSSFKLAENELEREKQSDEGFSERFLFALNGESAYSFAKRVGINDSLVRKYVSGASIPSLDRAVEIANALKCELYWLATGKGAMRKGDGAESTIPMPSSSPEPNDYCYIPLYDVYASAGHGSQIDQEPIVDRLAFKKDWLKGEMGLSPDKCCLIHVIGDSMEPTLHKKDVVMLDRTHTIYIDDGIYCLRIDGGLLVKRLQRINAQQFKVISDNSIYEPFVLNTQDVEVVGKAVWAGKRL